MDEQFEKLCNEGKIEVPANKAGLCVHIKSTAKLWFPAQSFTITGISEALRLEVKNFDVFKDEQEIVT